MTALARGGWLGDLLHFAVALRSVWRLLAPHDGQLTILKLVGIVLLHPHRAVQGMSGLQTEVTAV